MTDTPTPSEDSDEGPVEELSETAMPGHPILDVLCDGYEYSNEFGEHVVRMGADQIVEFAEEAKSVHFESCMELTVVDFYRKRPVRFELVLGFLSRRHNLRVRVLVPIDEETPIVPSLTDVYPGVGFFEREVFDMFGIQFTGNPDLTRILMPDDWEGHPLRKDYSVGSIPIQFRESPKVT